MLKTIKNPDNEMYTEVTKAVDNNSGYCPCSVERTPETKCICKEFREQECEGECHCGRFVKKNVED